MKHSFKIDSLRQMAVFTEVVSAGSMVAAAGRLSMTASAVSQHIRVLERQTGVQLLARTTRSLRPTEAGLRFFQLCREMLDTAEAAMEGLDAARDTPSGNLRITAPLGLGRAIAEALTPQLVKYPDLSLTLALTDETVALTGGIFDIAVRVGHLPDSSWSATPLGSLPIHMVAAPAYLARAGWRGGPDQLRTLDWLALDTHNMRGAALDIQDPRGQRRSVALDRAAVRAISSTQNALLALCEAGVGVAVLAGHDIALAIEEGRLQPVLPGWTIPALPITALAPTRTVQPAKIRFALGTLRQFLGSPKER